MRRAPRADTRQTKAEGFRECLLDEERPDVFTISVGNLPPGGEALIRITTVAEAPRAGY